MAFYLITITLKEKVVQGIRELEQENVDVAWEVFHSAAIDCYTSSKILDFQVVKISKYSDDYRKYILEKKKENVQKPKTQFNRKDSKHNRNISMGERAKRNDPPKK